MQRLTNFLYIGGEKSIGKWVIDNWFVKDLDNNNPLHYAYLSDMPDIRQILRQNKIDDEGDLCIGVDIQKQRLPASKKMNRRSQVPAQMRHMQKCEASSDDTDS